MKDRFLSVLLVLSILLVGCAQAGQSAVTPTPLIVVQKTAEPVEPTAPPPTNLPLVEPTETAVEEQPALEATEITTEPTSTSLPEATPIPCNGDLTSPNQEGPYYSVGSPERTSLIEDGMPGIPIMILGRVFDQDCHPIAGAKIDFWLADVNGEYDNVGFRLRGHLFSDENGYYALESIEPGLYTGRPPHIHVKVFAPDGRELLTTQMYFPGSEGSPDVVAAPDLQVTYLEPDEYGRQQVLFNFVVRY